MTGESIRAGPRHQAVWVAILGAAVKSAVWATSPGAQELSLAWRESAWSPLGSPAAARKNTTSFPVMGNQLYSQYQQAQSSQQASAASLYTTDFAMFGDLTNLPSGMETTGMTPHAETWTDMMEGMSHQDWADQMTGTLNNGNSNNNNSHGQ